MCTQKEKHLKVTGEGWGKISIVPKLTINSGKGIEASVMKEIPSRSS